MAKNVEFMPLISYNNKCELNIGFMLTKASHFAKKCGLLIFKCFCWLYIFGSQPEAHNF